VLAGFGAASFALAARAAAAPPPKPAGAAVAPTPQVAQIGQRAKTVVFWHRSLDLIAAYHAWMAHVMVKPL
jgi:hypothetical protein